MIVSGFMIPADKVFTVSPTDPVGSAIDLIRENNIGSIVVIEETDDKPMPVGIITKSDVVNAYQSGVPVHDPCRNIMSKGPLHTCSPRMGRDKAACIMETMRTHHLVVVNETDRSFLGLVSSWDISAECARDGRAWPFPRFAAKHEGGVADTSGHGHPTIVHHQHDTYTFADSLDVMQFQ